MFLHLSVILFTRWGRKVMFLHLSVILFTRWGIWADSPLGRHLPGQISPPSRHPPMQTPPWADTPHPRRPLQWMVCILLECILVTACTPPTWADTPQVDTPPGQCMLGYTPLPSACWDTQPPPLPSTCWNTVNKGAVRIPLNAFLFKISFLLVSG